MWSSKMSCIVRTKVRKITQHTQKMVRLRTNMNDATKKATPTPHKHDLLGPPDPLSNLRPVNFHVPQNESSIERTFRERRQQVQTWNQQFWLKHNSNFAKERDEFAASLGTEVTPSADQMSVFYKEFLDKNWKLHMKYNVDWYRKNLGLVYLAFKVEVHKLLKQN